MSEAANQFPVGRAAPAGTKDTTAILAGWWRYMVPSFSDCVFLFLLIWQFIVSKPGWIGLLQDGDTGWHIRVGEMVLATGSVPTVDPFSFSKPDAPWFAWEWLSEVGLAVIHSQLGLKGVTLAAGIMIVLFGWLLLRYMIWRGANAMVALVITLLATGAATVHYLARPHLVTMVFLVAALWLLDYDQRNATRWIWSLVPLTVLWTNLHGGFLVLLVAVGGLVAGRLAEGLVDPEVRPAKWRQGGRYALLLAGCAAASVVNPYGLELHRHIAAYLQSDWIKTIVNEFRSPNFRAENIMQYEVLLLLGVMAAGLLLVRKRFAEAFWILGWAHLSLGASRHIPIYVIFAGPLIATELTRWWDAGCRGSHRTSLRGILDQLSRDMNAGFRRSSLWPVALVLFLVVSSAPWLHWPQDFPDFEFPTAMIHRNAETIQNSRIFTDDQWADYLLYRFHPGQRVFMDGRTDFYGPEVGDKYIALMFGKPEWKQILREYDFDVVLVQADRPLAALMQTLDGWTVMDRDDEAVLFVRR